MVGLFEIKSIQWETPSTPLPFQLKIVMSETPAIAANGSPSAPEQTYRFYGETKAAVAGQLMASFARSEFKVSQACRGLAFGLVGTRLAEFGDLVPAGTKVQLDTTRATAEVRQ